MRQFHPPFYPPIFEREAPLVDRLLEARDRVSMLTRDRSPPRIQAPASANCDDVFICDALMEAASEIDRLRKFSEVSAHVTPMSSNTIAERRAIQRRATPMGWCDGRHGRRSGRDRREIGFQVIGKAP